MGIRTRGLPACSIVPQSTTLPRAPEKVRGTLRKGTNKKIKPDFFIERKNNVADLLIRLKSTLLVLKAGKE
jgi:hypothetical protein